jgi:hypothetical protein
MSATLRRDAGRALARLYDQARERASLGLREYGEDSAAAALPPVCPYTLDQVLDRNWYPAQAQTAGSEEDR